MFTTHSISLQVFFHDPDHNMIELQSQPRPLVRLSEDSDDSSTVYLASHEYPARINLNGACDFYVNNP